MRFIDRLKMISGSWYFLIAVVLVYVGIAIFNIPLYQDSINFFTQIIIKIIPLFISILVLMVISSYFITQEFILKHLQDKGIKKWFFVILGGLLSSGPIYMWYPLLADLKNKGLKQGLLACFLYNRAIKIPLLPLAIMYFTWQYILVLTLVMMIASVIQGMLLNKIIEL